MQGTRVVKSVVLTMEEFSSRSGGFNRYLLRTMLRVFLFITVASVTGCSQSDDLKERNAGTQEVASQTTIRRGVNPAKYEPKLWPISVEGKWGYIDERGSVKIEPQFANASPFHEGLALVSVFGTSEVDLVFDRTYDGFIDDSGKFAIPAEFPAFFKKREGHDSYRYSNFEDGVAVVRDASSSDGLKGLIDRKGNLIAPMVYDYLGFSFSEGLCSFETRTELGYMDYHGKVVLQPDGFLYGSGFSDGRAVITVRDDEGDKTLMIDRDGNVVVGPREYTAISGIEGGLSRVVKDGEVGLIDRDGRAFVPVGEYSQITEPDPGTTYIGEKNGVFYAIDSDAEPTKLPDFGAEPVRYCGDLIWIRSDDDKDGFATPDGTIVVEPVFDDLSFSFDGELCKFSRGSEQGYVNRSGKIVWSTKNWELPLQYSIREPLRSYLPSFGLEAMPLSYNWDCENAIVFVCDGKLAQLREHFLGKRSAKVEVIDYTNDETEPGKLDLMISFEGVAYLEVFAMHGDPEAEAKDAENADGFVSFYDCENMHALRKKFPGKTIGIILEN
ncbi:MAG: WG repeat-containing protein [Planctomycetota bacterium]